MAIYSSRPIQQNYDFPFFTPKFFLFYSSIALFLLLSPFCYLLFPFVLSFFIFRYLVKKIASKSLLVTTHDTQDLVTRACDKSEMLCCCFKNICMHERET